MDATENSAFNHVAERARRFLRPIRFLGSTSVIGLLLAFGTCDQAPRSARAAEIEPATLNRITRVDRWAATALQGGGLQMGDPTILTWSIVPDGTTIVPNRENESNDPSNLIETLNRIYGSQESWMPLIESTFDRWSELSGLSYVYVSDDGLAINPQNIAGGIVDRRGDIRIGGHTIGGSNGLAGYGYFPDHGDIVIDTSDSILANTDSNGLFLRNLVAHEHGHGLGMEHVVSTSDSFLMESFLSDFFDGPQFDEILLLHRAYGDALEKSGGNDSSHRATQLGTIDLGGQTKVGASGRSLFVDPMETDFVSIDGITDADYYTFEAPRKGQLRVTLEPVGPIYQQGNEGGIQSQLDASAINDLSVGLLSSGSIGAIVTADQGGLGETEQLEFVLPESGVYTLRILGKLDTPQLYSLTVEVAGASTPGDVNGDGSLDVLDIDGLSEALRNGSQSSQFDVDGNGIVNSDDRVWLIETQFGTVAGDANLDQEFDSTDLIVTFQSGEYEDDLRLNSGWGDGDFNGDGEFDSADMVAAFQTGRYEQGPIGATSVPEPESLLGWLAIPLLCVRRRFH